MTTGGLEQRDVSPCIYQTSFIALSERDGIRRVLMSDHFQINAQNREMDDDVKKSEQEEEEDGIRGGLAHAERIDGSTSPGHVCPNLNISHTH